MIRIKSDKIVLGEALFDGYIYIDGEKISEVSKNAHSADECYDFTGKFVSSGFIDMHTHGAGGFAFMNSTLDAVVSGCNFHLNHGTTSILPTVSAGAFSTMREAVKNIKAAMQSPDLKANIIGAHLEGPYLSAKQCGAQCPAFITPPIKEDYEGLVEEMGDAIARWTYAPEYDTDAEFCRYLTEMGIVVSAGHTDAKYPDMKKAYDEGCMLITHLYSCTSTITRDHGFRSLGVIESAYLLDDMFVEIIADGKHLPLELIQMIVKIKGPERVALITDSLEIAGTDITEGTMSGTDFIVEDGVCKLSDRSAFAGSVATADRLIKTMLLAGFDIPTAVKMLTETPANILGLNKGTLDRGRDADVVVFDSDISVSDIFVLGKKVK
jgi:N-acetylglucosamine-6-phosphate deacetylase